MEGTLHKLKRARTTLLYQSLSERRTALTVKKMNYYVPIQQDAKW